MSVNDSTVVQVTNNGPKPFKAGWASDWWNIKPGETRFVPYHAAVNWFGDPRAVNVGNPDVSRNTQYRTLERDRLTTLYGLYGNLWSTDEEYTVHDYLDQRPDIQHVHYVQRDDGRYYHPNLPNVTVKDASGEEEIPVVLNDPEGENVAGTEFAEKKSQEAAIADLQQRLASLQIQVARQNADQKPKANPEFDNADDTSTDEPSVTPQSRDDDESNDDEPVRRRGPGRPRRS